MLCFKDSRKVLHAIEVAVVQFAQVHLVNMIAKNALTTINFTAFGNSSLNFPLAHKAITV